MSKGSKVRFGVLIGLVLAVPAGTPLADEAGDMQPISHFSIDRTEVTIGQFARFDAATGFVTKAERAGGGLVYAAGWAIAYRQYSRDYVDDESAAQAEKAGIWAGRFIEPSKWRRGDRLAVESAKEPVAASCQIKGNISRSGERIYHVPGARDYGPTRIDESKGERWFCSEDEARKAGWRRSVR